MKKTYELKELGIIVIRFTNEEVQRKINEMLQIISEITKHIVDKKYLNEIIIKNA